MLHVRPLVAELFLTDNCNLRCVSCGCWRETTRGELTTSEWQNVLTQLATLPIRKVNFTGGEPLLRRDAATLMRFARDVGIRHMHLNTNATLLTPAKLDEIIDAGVRSFNISVDGPQAVHDHLRGKAGAFDLTTKHLQNLLAKRPQHHLKVRMNFTVMRDNVSIVPRMAEFAQAWGVQLYLNLATDKTFLFRDKVVGAQTIIDAAELKASFDQLERMIRKNARLLPRYSDLRYMARHFSDALQPSLPCAESQLKLMIHSRGEIGGCWAHDPAATVRASSIRDVVDGVHYRREHARLFRKDCVGCGSNYSLNLRWRPLTYLVDAMWRVKTRQSA